MLKIYYTFPGHQNITGILFKEALRNSRPPDYSNILYLTPTSTKVRDAQKVFRGLIADKCYVTPEMATISQFSKKLYSISGNRRILRKALVPVVISMLSERGIGFSSITADFISDLKKLYPDAEPDFIKARFETIFYELNIPDSVAKAVYESLDTFKEYSAFMLDNNLIDDDDVLNASFDPSLVGHHSTLVLDGFYDPVKLETKFMKRLIDSVESVYVSIPYDERFKQLVKGYADFLKENFKVEEVFDQVAAAGKPDETAFVYYSCPDIEEEVEGIARNIKSLFVSGKFKKLEEIAITFPDLEKYSAMVERIFRRYGIPCDVTAGKPLGTMKPFLDLLALLTSVAEDYPRLQFSRFLSSEYFSRISESLREWVPSLSIQSGIVSGKGPWLSFISEGSEILDIEQIKARTSIDKDLERVFERLLPLENMREGGSLSSYADLLKGLLNDLGFLSPPKDSFTRNLLRTTGELLELVSFLGILRPTRVALPQFTEIFRHLLNTSYLETEGMGVKVIGFQEILGTNPEYLYFGGLTDSAMPGRQDLDYILPDSVRKRLGMANLDKHIDIRRSIFYGLLKSCRHIHLSYPLMDGDNVFIPSSFLYPGEQLREKLPGIYSKEEYLVGTGKRPFSGFISEVGTSASISAYLKGGTIRVTDIDAYRTCPRKFFIERTLKLRPLNVKEYELEAATVGIIIHKIMERLIKEPFEDLEYLRERARAISEDIMKDKKIYTYWKRLVTDSFLEILPDIYEKELEIREEGYLSTEVEKNINGEPIEGIKLSGKIDRFDRVGDSVQIIDYKTGTAGLTCSQVLKGNENLQLFLYAAIMKNHGYKVKRVGIYSLKDVDIKWCPPKKRGKGKCDPGHEIDEYIVSSLQFLETAADSLRSGDFPAKPLSDYICWNCHENAFCPYMQS